MSYFGVSLRNGVGLGLGTVPSLTNTPLSYRLAPSLDLSFAGSDTLSPAITFSRTTNATLTNSAGLIANAPMNLLTFSEQFDNAAWVKGGVTITANATASPDGTTTADRYVESALNEVHSISSISVTAASGATYTLSVYAKNAGRFLRLILPAGTFGVAVSANFDLVNGIAYDTAGSGAVIQSVGNGWYRCSICVTATTGATGTISVSSAATSSGTGSYTGDGISGVYLWGAQLELGSTATTYNPTTVKNLLGFTEHFDNAAWTKSNAFVQTNLVTNSVFANTGGAAPTGYSQSFGTGVSAPSGTASNGDVIYTQTAAAERPFFVQELTTVVGVTYTNSMTITEASGVTVAQVIGAAGVTSTYTLNGVSVLGSTLVTPGVLASTWTATATNNVPRFGIGITGNATGSISFHSAQVVQGTTPGDYKATYGAAAAVGYTDIYGQPFAQKLVENTANSTHRLFASATLTTAPYTLNVYLKAAERQWAYLRIDRNGGTSPNAWFDLSSGTLGAAETGLTPSIQNIGNDWYRCSITVDAAVAGLNNIIVGTTTANSTISYTGDGTSGIYIFGAQLSDSASVDPYVYQPVAAPTSTAYYGPRFDYDPVTLAPKGLLIEEQRTNLLTYSEQFDNAVWTKSGATVGANAVVSPDGTVDAEKLTEDTATGAHILFQAYTGFASGTSYTASIYAKAAERSVLSIVCTTGVLLTASFNLANGTVTATNGTGTITSVGNGWYRCTVSNTATSTTSGNVQYRLNNGSSDSYTGNGVSGIYIWGAQLEAGAFATSYIPTVASQVTRAADSASMIGNNFARWYNQTEGTLFGESQILPGAAQNRLFFVGDGTANNYLSIAMSASGTVGAIITGASNQTDSFPTVSATSGIYYKQALAYAINDAASSRNGAAVNTDTLVALPTVNFMGIGFLVSGGNVGSGHIKRIAYYNRRLSNTELQGITS